MSFDPPIVPRAYWRPFPAKWAFARDRPIKYVFNGVTGSGSCVDYEDCLRTVQRIQRFQMIACPDIRYNFLIGGDLRIYEGRGWDIQPGLSNDFKKYNPNALFIGYIGDFSKDPGISPAVNVPPEMEALANSLVLYALEKSLLKPNFHREDLF